MRLLFYALIAFALVVPVFSLLNGDPPQPFTMVGVLALAWVARARLTVRAGTGTPFGGVVLAMLASGLLLELFAWTMNYGQQARVLALTYPAPLRYGALYFPPPILFHPQLIPDLILGAGLYASWGMAWWLILRRYRFTLAQVLVAHGVYGIVVENNAAVLLTFNPLLWGYVAVSYGATAALALLPFLAEFPAAPESRWKYAFAFTALAVAHVVLATVWFLAWQPALPPPRPMYLAPLY